MNRLISGRIFRKMAALVKKIMIGIVMIAICLFIYEELVGPAIAYVLEKPKQYIRALKESNNLSLSDLPISDFGELAKVGDPMDIFDISKFELTQLTENEQREVLYIKNDIQRKVIYKRQKVYYLQFSPAQDKLGFYYYPDGNTLKDVALVIIDIPERTAKEVYRESIRTSGWKWFSNNEVLVQYNCGSECQVLYLIDINSDKKYTLQYGVGYEWSPNQQMVLAYHYSGQPGITVGNKFGKAIFDFLREPPDIYTKLIEQTEAVWSPDGARVALLIKRKKEEALEIIVFDVNQKFKQIFRENLTGEAQDIKFFWQEKDNLVYKDLSGEREVVF